MNKGILFYLAGMSVSLANYDLVIEVPKIKTAEYHRPYIASWVEDGERNHVANLALWYEMKEGDHHGEKWLKDIRKWWRKSGRELKFPVEGLSSPTKPPGVHRISLKKMLEGLPADGSKTYKLYVEASREVGGREYVAIEFRWDGKQLTVKDGKGVEGKSELGTVVLTPHGDKK